MNDIQMMLGLRVISIISISVLVLLVIIIMLKRGKKQAIPKSYWALFIVFLIALVTSYILPAILFGSYGYY